MGLVDKLNADNAALAAEAKAAAAQAAPSEPPKRVRAKRDAAYWEAKAQGAKAKARIAARAAFTDGDWGQVIDLLEAFAGFTDDAHIMRQANALAARLRGEGA